MKMKWKNVVVAGIMGLSLLGFSVPKASASMTPTQYWKTEDGLWDGSVTTGQLNVVEVDLMSLYKVNRNNNYSERLPLTDTSMLAVRLCKPYGAGCTGWIGFSRLGGYPYARFYGLALNQKYYVDIRDSWSNYYFKGTLTATY
ncbi:hypothetical protein [Fictibacillus sp. NRS-1165]|uniref:hypothetical protein n=1 Tax=Fictibacillus sp. NRS-1165 TaxID=3144463 RepID=UPI003D20FF22